MADGEGSKVSISAVRKRKARKPKFAPVAGATSVEALNLQPLVGHALADDIRRQVADALGVPADLQVDERLARASERARRVNEVDEREAAETAAGRKVRRGAMKRLSHYEREKPTAEEAARGEFEVLPAERFDTSRKGEKVLVNLAARGRGAATMFKRNQISAREFRAAEELYRLFDLSQASQLSGVPMQERVDGGMVDTRGDRLRSAAKAAGEYRDALETLTTAGRVLVENVVVLGVAMESAVRMRTVAHRLGGGEKDMRRKVDRAHVVVSEALDKLADHFRIAK